eukprot:11522309-Alexandrium_andersonii.AAC.1
MQASHPPSPFSRCTLAGAGGWACTEKAATSPSWSQSPLFSRASASLFLKSRSDLNWGMTGQLSGA